MKTYTPRQCVELFHLLFLNHLGHKLDKKLYALKGGCNMRFYFNSIRYSEDIDIDIQIINKDTLFKNVDQILRSTPLKSILKSHEIEILDIIVPKQTPTTQRWKVSLKFSTSALALHTKIEFSRRQFGSHISFEAISPQIVSQYSLTPFMTSHYTIQSMIEQKILALALRKETQARDIFDLHLLFSLGKNLKSLSKETIQHLSAAINNAKNIPFENFKGQVIAYLLDHHKKQYDDKSLWGNIIQTVITTLAELT